MSSLVTNAYRLYKVFLIAVLLCITVPGQAQEKVAVAVVLDGPSARLANQQQLYVDELLVLTENEFDVEIREFMAEWTRDSTFSTIDAAYADPDVDLVLAVGFVANQVAETAVDWPAGHAYEIGGETESSGDANASIAAELPMAGMVIPLLLVGQFNSLRRPVIILSTIPLGLIGVTFGLLIAISGEARRMRS